MMRLHFAWNYESGSPWSHDES